MRRLLAIVTALALAAPAASGEVRLGTDGAYPPYVSTAPDGTLEGFEPDLARAICAAAELTCTWVVMPFEDLEAARSRAAVVQDELSNRLAERINLRMYALTIIAAIFLPLTLISGMFGMNVGGVPFLEHGVGFWLVTGGMLLLGVVGVWIARLKDWL